MATLAAICDGLRDRFLATAGVTSAYAVPPTVLGPLPCGVVFLDPEQVSDITTANLSITNHRLLCRLYVAPAKNLPAEMAQGRAFVEPFIDAINGGWGLGLDRTFYGATVTGYRADLTARYGDVEYVAVEWLITAKSKAATEFVR